ncbi:hypothetical protein [Nostoc sp.]
MFSGDRYRLKWKLFYTQPEVAVGGAIALIQEGDSITIDIDAFF